MLNDLWLVKFIRKDIFPIALRYVKISISSIRRGRSGGDRYQRIG